MSPGLRQNRLKIMIIDRELLDKLTEHAKVNPRLKQVWLRGKCLQYLFNNEGNQIDAIYLQLNSRIMGMSVEAGQWHRLESLESGTIIFECKDGANASLEDIDILNK